MRSTKNLKDSDFLYQKWKWTVPTMSCLQTNDVHKYEAMFVQQSQHLGGPRAKGTACAPAQCYKAPHVGSSGKGVSQTEVLYPTPCHLYFIINLIISSQQLWIKAHMRTINLILLLAIYLKHYILFIAFLKSKRASFLYMHILFWTLSALLMHRAQTEREIWTWYNKHCELLTRIISGEKRKQIILMAPCRTGQQTLTQPESNAEVKLCPTGLLRLTRRKFKVCQKTVSPSSAVVSFQTPQEAH